MTLGLGAAVLLVFVIGTMVAPSRASAEWRVQFFYPNGEAAYGWYEDGVYKRKLITSAQYKNMIDRMYAGAVKSVGGTPSGVSTANTNAGNKIWSEIDEALKKTPSSKMATMRGIAGKAMGVLDKIGRFPPLKAFGTVSLAYSALNIGYSSVGGPIADFFFGEKEDEPEQQGAFRALGASLIGEGGEICNVTGGPKCVAPANKALKPVHEVRFTQEGDPGSTITSMAPYSEEETGGKCTHPGVIEVPESAFFHQTGTTTCGGKDGVTYTVAYGKFMMPFQVSAMPPNGTGADGKKTGSNQTALGAVPAKEVIEKIVGDPQEDDFTAWWWHHDEELRANTVADGESGVDPLNPLWVTIPAPGAHEHVDLYVERLQKLDVVAEPVALPDYAIDPSRGPEEVVTTAPAPGKQVQPGATVRVRYNPSNAPDPIPAPAGNGCGGTVNSVSLTPLTEIPLGDKFPFGVIGFFVGWIAEWETGEGNPPTFDLLIVNDVEMHVDMSVMEPVMEPARIAILFASFVGLLWFLGTAAMRLNGDNS